MTATEPSALDKAIRELEWQMKVRFDAWPVDFAYGVHHYTSRHQQFYVKVIGSAAVIYSFYEVIELSRPAINPIPGA